MSWPINKDGRDAFTTSMCFILYAVARSIVSLTRGDDLYLGPIKAPHLASAILIVAFGLLTWRRRLYKRSMGPLLPS